MLKSRQASRENRDSAKADKLAVRFEQINDLIRRAIVGKQLLSVRACFSSRLEALGAGVQNQRKRRQKIVGCRSY